MNQLFTRLLLLSVVLVGFVVPKLFAQSGGIDAADTDEEPCFAIWDTDEDRGKNLTPLLRRFIDIYIPNSLTSNNFRAVVRFYDQSSNLLAVPGPGNNNGLVQDIFIPNLDPNITASSTLNGDIYTFELNTPFPQSSVAFVSLDLYAFFLNAWLPLHNSNNQLWDVNNPNPRNICWNQIPAASKDKGDTGRLGAISSASIWAFPNPTSGYLQIAPLTQSNSLKLYDIRGSLMQSWEFAPSENPHKISVQAFPAGIYYLKRQIGLDSHYQRIQVLK